MFIGKEKKSKGDSCGDLLGIGNSDDDYESCNNSYQDSLHLRHNEHLPVSTISSTERPDLLLHNRAHSL